MEGSCAPTPPREGGRNVSSGTVRRSARQLGERGICKMRCNLRCAKSPAPAEAAQRATAIDRAHGYAPRRHRRQRRWRGQTFSSSLQHLSSSQVYADAARRNSDPTRTVGKHPYSVTHSPYGNSASGSRHKLLFYRVAANGSRKFRETPEISQFGGCHSKRQNPSRARRSGPASPILHKPFAEKE